MTDRQEKIAEHHKSYSRMEEGDNRHRGCCACGQGVPKQERYLSFWPLGKGTNMCLECITWIKNLIL